MSIKNIFSRFISFFTLGRLAKVFIVAMLFQSVMLGLLYKNISDTQKANRKTGLANQEISKTVRHYTSPEAIKDNERKLTKLVVSIKCDNENTAQRLVIALKDQNQKQISILSKECSVPR